MMKPENNDGEPLKSAEDPIRHQINENLINT